MSGEPEDDLGLGRLRSGLRTRESWSFLMVAPLHPHRFIALETSNCIRWSLHLTMVIDVGRGRWRL